MRRIISFISIFILFINLFAFPITVKADGLPIPGYTELKEMQQDIENGDNRTIQDIWHILQPVGEAVGVIMNPIQTIEFIRDIVDPAVQSLPNYPTNGSDTEKANFVTNYMLDNVTFDNSNKTYTLNSNSRSLLNSVIQNYINNNGLFYAYTFDLRLYSGQFNNGVAYRDLFNKGTDKTKISVKNTGLSFFTRPQVDNLGFVVANKNSSANWVRVYPFNLDTWEAYEFNWNQYDFVNNTYVKTSVSVNNVDIYLALDGSVASSNMDYGLFTNGVIAYPVYESFEQLRDDNDGVQSYYVNNPVYNTWNNTSGDYTVDSNNSNRVTYTDITNYIGNDPNVSIPDIQIYIDNNDPTVTPTPLPTPTPTPGPNNPGGNSGSNNTVSGNGYSANASASANGGSASANNEGINISINNNHNINFNVPGLSGNGIDSGTVSGNGSGSGSIFDWISDIGGVIGDFIKNVGDLIADVVKGITETITTILADIPNIISVLVEFVYGGLPDELKAIVTLGITTVIFVGVIKMMRK